MLRTIVFPVLILLGAAEAGEMTAPQVGSRYDGGIYLHREYVGGVYWDDWIAYPLMDHKHIPSDDQVELTIKGEGKTASFYGVLSINCTNHKYFWQLSPSEEFEIPKRVYTNAITLFCRH